MRAFWQLSGFTERLLTAEGIDTLNLLVTGQAGGEAAVEAIERMSKLAPSPVKFSTQFVIEQNSQRDEEGFAALKAMQ